jgi:hypothetical protein
VADWVGEIDIFAKKFLYIPVVFNTHYTGIRELSAYVFGDRKAASFYSKPLPVTLTTTI